MGRDVPRIEVLSRCGRPRVGKRACLVKWKVLAFTYTVGFMHTVAFFVPLLSPALVRRGWLPLVRFWSGDSPSGASPASGAGSIPSGGGEMGVEGLRWVGCGGGEGYKDVDVECELVQRSWVGGVMHGFDIMA